MARTANLPAIQFDYKPAPLRIIDNGHTIQINYPAGSFITVGDKRYELKQIHFHKPSEERINGKAYPMVAPIVHQDAEDHLASRRRAADGRRIERSATGPTDDAPTPYIEHDRKEDECCPGWHIGNVGDPQTDEPARCERAGVPQNIRFATKHEITLRQIEAALAAGIARGTVLMDTGYENARLGDELTGHGLQYVAGIHPQTMPWWGEHQPGQMLPKPKRGPQRKRAVRDATHQPISALEIAQTLPAESPHRDLARRHERAPLFAFCASTGACGAR